MSFLTLMSHTNGPSYKDIHTDYRGVILTDRRLADVPHKRSLLWGHTRLHWRTVVSLTSHTNGLFCKDIQRRVCYSDGLLRRCGRLRRKQDRLYYFNNDATNTKIRQLIYLCPIALCITVHLWQQCRSMSNNYFPVPLNNNYFPIPLHVRESVARLTNPQT